MEQDLQVLRNELKDYTGVKRDIEGSKLAAMQPVSFARAFRGVSSAVEDVSHAGIRAGTVRQSQVQFQTEK